MKEFKTFSFIIFDEKGKVHKIKIDKLEDELPEIQCCGNKTKLLERFNTLKFFIEQYLKGN